MAKPWEKYQDTGGKPWKKYQGAAPVSESGVSDHRGGIVGDIWRLVSGEGRETDKSRKLDMVDVAPEFSGWSLEGVKSLAEHPLSNLAMAFTSDPVERIKIIKERFKDANFWKDDKGNIGVDLPSGQYMLNKPGVHLLDVVNFAQQGLELAAASALTGGAAAGAGIEGLTGKLAAEGAAGALSSTVEQGAEAAGGGDFSGKEIAESAGLNMLFPAMGAAKKSLLPGKKAAESLAQDIEHGQGSDEVKNAIRELGSSWLKRDEKMKAAAELVQPNIDAIQAAQRLGIDANELLPHHYSNNEAFRSVIGGIASMQGTGLMEAEEKLLQRLEDVTTNFVTENGGGMDGSIISMNLKDRIDDEINGLEQLSKQYYEHVDNVISPLTKVNAPHTLEHLNSQADKFGGLDRLTKLENDVSKDFGPEGVRTWAGFNDRRADVGDAMDKLKAGDKRREFRRAAMLYGPMKEDGRSIAEEHGVLPQWDKANGLYAASEQLKKVKTQLFGPNEQFDAMPRITEAMKGLSKGKTAKFQKMMALIPDDEKNAVIMTALGKMFSEGSAAKSVLHLPGITNWLRDVKGNEAGYNALIKNMSPGARQQLDDIFTAFSAINQGRRSLIADTGNKLRDLAQSINDTGGFTAVMAKHPKKAKAAKIIAKPALSMLGFAHGGTLGGMGGLALAAAAEKAGGNAVPAAARLLKTQEFTDLATMLEQGLTDGSEVDVAEHLSSEMAKTPQYKSWLKEMTPQVRKAVMEYGFVQWLIHDMSAERGRREAAGE